MVPVNFSSELVETNWVPRTEFSWFWKNETLQHEKFFRNFCVRTVKIVVRKTFTSESTGFKTRLPITLGYSEIELNVFDLVHSSIGKGPNSIVFGKFFQLERFRSTFFQLERFCLELEGYRPLEHGSKIFRSKRTELRKKLGGTYKKENFWF